MGPSFFTKKCRNLILDSRLEGNIYDHRQCELRCVFLLKEESINVVIIGEAKDHEDIHRLKMLVFRTISFLLHRWTLCCIGVNNILEDCKSLSYHTWRITRIGWEKHGCSLYTQTHTLISLTLIPLTITNVLSQLQHPFIKF